VKTRTESGELSICQWSLTVRFKTKDQCAELIRRIFDMDLQLYPKMWFSDDSEESPEYSVEIEYQWAHQLSAIAAILEAVDEEMLIYDTYTKKED